MYKVRIRYVLFIVFAFTTSYLNANSDVVVSQEETHNELTIYTSDNVIIRGNLFKNDNDKVIIYCHRLLGSQHGEEVNHLLEAFIDDFDIITFNFRGHKRSTLVSNIGGDEILDLRAVISFAVNKGYHSIVIIGVGMGGSVAIRTAGIFRNIDAVIVVSPAGFSPERQPLLIKIGTDITLNTDFGKVPLRILTNTRLGTRYTSGYPIDIIAAVSPIPLLVVQSKNDRLVNLDQIRHAYDRALEPKQLIVVPGSLHADQLLVNSILTDIGNWLKDIFPGPSYKDLSLLNENPINDYPDSTRIILTGDLPLPEEVLLLDFHERQTGPTGTPNSTKINTESVLRDLKNVFSFYGYTVTSITVSDSDSVFWIQVSIPKIHSVSIEGNRWVTDDYIQSILKIDGDYYNAYELDVAIRRVSSESSIQTVKSDITMREDRNVDLLLTVIEQKPYRPLVSTKFTDIDQFYGIGFTWNEFNPSGIQLAGNAMVGIFDRDLHTSFSLGKNVWGNNIRLDGKYFNTIKSRDDLDYVYTRQEVHELGGEVVAGYRMTSTITVNFGLFGKEYKSPKVTTNFPVREGTALGNFLKLDVNGQLPLQGLPRFIWRHTFYHQNSGLGGRGDFNFNTYQLNFTGELKLWRQHRSVTSFHHGWLSGNAPPQELFSLGGMTTLPGYPDDSFVNTHMLRISQVIYLSANTWVAETSLLAPLRLIFSFNSGTVWADDKNFNVSDLKMDVGFEFDYKEVLRLGIAGPVGPKRRSARVYIGWGIHVL